MHESRIPTGRRTVALSAALLAVLCLLLGASCAAHVSKAASGTIKLALGGFRGLETGWPDGKVPTFGTVKVTVSAGDMDTVSKTFSATSGTITLELPAGSNRLVQVEALPASGSGAPYFALSYTGSATVDLEEGKTTTAVITLALAKTKLFLQDCSSWSIYTADSITGTVNPGNIPYAYFNPSSDPSFDDYGRLYYYDAEMSYLYRYTAYLETPEQIYLSNFTDNGTAYSPSNRRLYFFYNNDYWQLQYVDVTQTGEPSSVWVYQPSEVMYFQNVVTVDEEGYVYACSYEEATGYDRIVKMSVGAESESYAQAYQVASALYSDVGLTYSDIYPYSETPFTVQDMCVKDGVLYVTASHIRTSDTGYDSYSQFSCRGKVVAFSTADLTKLWECGWSGTGNQFPTDPSTQFYFPTRFIGIAPKKLYIADDGFSFIGTTAGSASSNQNRVVEVDVADRAISAIGLEDVVEFYSSYTYALEC